MQKLSQKLISLHQSSDTPALTASIFGTNRIASQYVDRSSVLKIAMLPLLYEQNVPMAMGLWTILGYLLEDTTGVRVYRLFAKLDGEPDDYEWEPEKSQFEIEDWDLEYLDENSALWGTLQDVENGFQLEVQYETDLLTGDDEAGSKIYNFRNLTEMIEQLPQIALDIQNAVLGESVVQQSQFTFDLSDGADESQIVAFLESLFYWEVQLLLFLWGVDWEDEDILEMFAELRTLGEQLNDEFASWCVSKALARVFVPGFSLIGDLLVPQAEQVVSNLRKSVYPVQIVIPALYQFGNADEAYRLLEAESKIVPDRPEVWQVMGNTYRRGSRLKLAIEAFQSAFENDLETPGLYRDYAACLLVADYQGEYTDNFVFTEPDSRDENALLREAVEAYEHAIELQPDDLDSMFRQTLQLLALDETRFWLRFRQLVELDQTGDLVREVVDGMLDIENPEPAIAILSQELDANQDRIDLWLNLAAAQIVCEFYDDAIDTLEVILERTDDPDIQAEVERMWLTAEDPDFEYRFGELTGIVDAGNQISDSDLEYLESVIERAPTFEAAYLVLARAYMAWDEQGTAIEVLLDANERFKNHPDVLELLGANLWATGEHELALQYLQRGITSNPLHVPLLSRIALCLFEDDRFQESREFILRAEAIAPRHPSLAAAKQYIALNFDDS